MNEKLLKELFENKSLLEERINYQLELLSSAL